MITREYPFDKAILLNSVYDVLERMALPLQYADSRNGILRFLCDSGIGELDLTAILRERQETTRLDISGAGNELPAMLLDEIAASLSCGFGRSSPEHSPSDAQSLKERAG